MELDLFSEFETIEVGVETYLNESDQRSLQRIQDEYKTILDNLKQSKSILTDLTSTYPVKDSVIGKKYQHSEPEVHGVPNYWDDKFSLKEHYKFDFNHGLLYVTNMIVAAYDAYQIRIYAYLRKEYALKEYSKEHLFVESEDYFCEYEEIVKLAAAYHDNIQFKEAGTIKFIADAREILDKPISNWGINAGEPSVTVNKNKVTFESFVYYDGLYNHRISNYHNFTLAIRAVWYSISSKIELPYYIESKIPEQWSENVCRTFLFDTDLNDQLISLRIFKNHKMEVKFKTEALARNFMSTFNLP